MISASRPDGAGHAHFRPRLGPTLAAIAGVAVLLGLGTWQMQRLEWKQALIAERDARLAAPVAALPIDSADWRTWDFRRVVVRGRFEHDLEQLLGASKHGERLGHRVLTPLLRPDGSTLLVDRGWVPTDRADPAARREGQVEGEVEIAGIARYRADTAPGWFTPANQPDDRVWYGYDLDALEAALGLELLPIVVEADETPNPGGLPIGGQTIPALSNNHLQYAITWYGLAASLVVIYLLFSMRRMDEAE
jgi:surfeit locus 1 family protein